LQTKDEVGEDEADDLNGQHRDRVEDPALLVVLFDSGEPVKADFHRPQDGVKERPSPGEHLDHESAQVPGAYGDGDEGDRNPDQLKHHGSEALRKEEGDKQVDGDGQRDDAGHDIARHQGSLFSPNTYARLPMVRSTSRPTIQISSGMM